MSMFVSWYRSFSTHYHIPTTTRSLALHRLVKNVPPPHERDSWYKKINQLLLQGYDPFEKDDDGHTVLDLAADQHVHELCFRPYSSPKLRFFELR